MCTLSLVQLFDCSLPGFPVLHFLQAPLSMGFSRQENWSELPCPPPGDLLDRGIEPRSPVLAGGFFTTEPPGNLKPKSQTLPRNVLLTSSRKRWWSSLGGRARPREELRPGSPITRRHSWASARLGAHPSPAPQHPPRPPACACDYNLQDLSSKLGSLRGVQAPLLTWASPFSSSAFFTSSRPTEMEFIP